MPAWLPPAFTAPCRKPQTDAPLIGNRRAVRKRAKYGHFLDFLADGRDVIGIANVPIYFDGEGLPVDFLVISRDTPPEAAAMYCPNHVITVTEE